MSHPAVTSDIVQGAALSRGKTTYDAFLESCDSISAEWVDGEILRMSPASKQHQLLADFLTALLRHYCEARQLGVVLSAPFQMKTGNELPGREPDLLFVAAAHLDRLHNNHLAGPADLVVEIVSPESLARDRGEKFGEYERGGVREYWLIDPLRRLGEFYLLDAGAYHAAAPQPDGIYRSAAIPGLWLRVEWLWRDPLPPLLSVLKEWQLI